MVKKCFPLLFLVFFLISCNEEKFISESEENDVTLSATFEQHVTKTSLTSANSVVWSTGDEISVLSDGNNDKFTLISGAQSTSAIFSGSVLSTASKYYALYPYSSSASFDGTNISFSLPEEQSYVENSFGNGANPSIATFLNSTEELHFKNICGVLSVYLKGKGSLSSIEVTSKKDEYLWGRYVLSANSYVGTDDQTLTYSSDGGKTITLNCGGVTLTSTAKEFDIVVPANSFSAGFDVVCNFATEYGIASRQLSSSEAQTIIRSQKHIMGTANVVPPEYFNLENDVVREYIDSASVTNPYVDGDLTVSYITDYYTRSTAYRKDRPSPVTIEWDLTGSPEEQYLTVSLNSDFSNPYYDKEEISNSISTYDIYDLIPGKKYYYKITDEDNEIIVSSDFNTLGRRRMLNIDGMFNVRDLGGIQTADGHTIKFGKLFRGGRTNYGNIVVTSAGKQAIKRAGIMVEIDLRWDDESGYLTSSYFNEGAYEVEYKRFSNSSLGAYGSINKNPQGIVNINELQYVIDKLKEDKPIYFHCSVGADRTGTLACMIEGLLGVRESQFSIDYELTSFSKSFSEVLLRTRTDTGKYNLYPLYYAILDVPDNIEGVTYPSSVTTSLQRRFYNYYYRGINGTKISQEDLNWFIDYMLE